METKTLRKLTVKTKTTSWPISQVQYSPYSLWPLPVSHHEHFEIQKHLIHTPNTIPKAQKYVPVFAANLIILRVKVLQKMRGIK